MKPKIGLFGLTGCAGCQLSVLFIEDILFDILDKVELVNAIFFKEKNKEKCDIAIVGGLVADKHDLERLKKIRKNCKTLIALGACAVHGNVPSMKNFMNKRSVERAAYNSTKHLNQVKPTPLSEHVKIDFFIPGCPPSRNEIIKYIKDILLEKKLVENKKSVCFECNLKENECLLNKGKPCLGPLTRAGCNALCPSHGKECTGCRGPIEDGNIEEIKKLFKDKGIDPKRFVDKINKYAGLEFKELMEKNEKKN